MTWPITPLQSIHIDPTALATIQLQFRAAYTALEQIFSKLPAEIIDALVNVILTTFGFGAVTGDVHTLLAALEAALSDIPQGNISGLVTDLETAGSAFVQALRDVIATALGHPGTGHTDADILSYLGIIPAANVLVDGTPLSILSADWNAITQGWMSALNALHLATPTSLIQQIPGSIPALVRDAEGGLSAVGSGLTRDAEGAITWVEDGLTHLVQQADQAVLSLPQVGQQIVHAAETVAPALGAGVADVIHAGQSAHTALTNAISAAGVVEHDIVTGAAELGNIVSGTVSAASGAVTQIEDAAGVFAGEANAGVHQLGNVIGAFLGGIAAYWGGATPPPHPSGPLGPTQAMIDAAVAAAAAQALAAQQTAAINAQLPHFYGGSGTAGTNVEQSFSGLTSLPAGFTSASTIAAASARCSTASVSSSQTTSGIWSVSVPWAKYLFLRMNAAATTYVYAKIVGNDVITGVGHCEIGCVVAGSRHVFSTFALPGGAGYGGSAGSLVSNSVYTFEATGNVFQLTGPNSLNESYTDGTVGGSPSVSQWDPDNTTHVYGYSGFGNDGTTVGAQTVTTGGSFSVPAGFTTGDKFDFGVFGGSGGGAGGSSTGYGGVGYGVAASLIYGTDIPLSTSGFTISPGAGGAGGAAPSGGFIPTIPGGPGGPGGTTTLYIPGYTGSPITAAGGGGGSTGSLGSGSSYGYATIDNLFWGAPPRGVPSGFAGGAGGAGRVEVVPVSMHALPGTLLIWAFYDSGPGAGPGGALVVTDETRSLATYGPLATTTDQIEVIIGPSGMAQVFLGAEFYNTSAGNYVYVSFALSGANNVTAATMESLGKFLKNGSSTAKFGEPFMVYNLASGATSFEMEFRTDGTGIGHFANRSIDAIPL